MASPDGRPVYFKRVPWHEEPAGRSVSPPKPLDEVPALDPSPKPESLTQDEYDAQPKGV